METQYDIQSTNILIVDDEESIRDLLGFSLNRASYNCEFAKDGQEAEQILLQAPFDIVVTDIDMPNMNGIELARKIISDFTADVIVMTGQIHDYQYDEIVTIGAKDFVEKPFSPREMILRIDRVVRERVLRKEMQIAHDALKESYMDSVHRLVMAAEYKDEDTGTHIIRIGEYSRLLAEKMEMAEDFRENILYASPMHDVGKIGIPDKILLKPGKLTPEEFEIIKTHTLIGAKLLDNSKSAILKLAHEIALTHHEKFNGKGYPNQLEGRKIPIAGRIVAIADTFDALTSKRPYKDPYPPEITLDIIKKERGEHFDPDILDIFISNFDIFLKIRGKNYSGEAFTISERDYSSL